MKQPPIIRSGFTLGVKSSLDPTMVPVNALYRGLNIHPDDSGILRIRRGVETVSVTMDGAAFQGAVSAFDEIIGIHNRSVYRFDQAGTATQIGDNLIGASASDRVKFINWSRNGAEILYLFAGNGIIETAGTTTALSPPYTPASGEKSNLIRNTDGTQNTNSGPAKCRFAVLKASLSQRIALAGNPNSPNTVYFSAPLDATYWPSDQILQLPDDGGKITGMVNWYNALVIFRDKDIWAFFGSNVADSGASLVLQEGGLGCRQGNTIAIVPTLGIVFLGPDNIYALQGVSGIENQIKAVPLADDVRGFLARTMTYGLDKVDAIYFDREYRIAFPESPEKERVFRLALQQTPGWYIDTGPLTSRYFIHKDKLHGCDLQLGILYRFSDTLTDNGKVIPYSVMFRRESLQPGPSRIKKIYIYAITKGAVKDLTTFFYGAGFNEKIYGVPDENRILLNTSTDQTLKIQVVTDDYEYEVKEVWASVRKMQDAKAAEHEPIRVYEARFSPSLKGNFAQIRIMSEKPDEDIAIIGYGIEYSSRQRIHGIKTGVTV